MSLTKVVVVIHGNQHEIDNLLHDLFETESQADGAEEAGYPSNIMEAEYDLMSEDPDVGPIQPYRELKQRFSRGMSCHARIRYREPEAVVLDVLSPRDLHIYFDLVELSEKYEGLLIDYWESDNKGVTYSGQILAGTELYRVDAFYSQEKKHKELGKSIRVRVAPQMTKELEECTNLKRDLAEAFKDADILITF